MGADPIEALFGHLDGHLRIFVLDYFQKGTKDSRHGGIFANRQMSDSP